MTSWAIRRALLLACLPALLVASAAACGGGNGDHTVVGVIIDVKSTSLTSIDSFTLRTNGGKTLVFEVSPSAVQDPVEGFVPGHLRTHALAAEQVRISYLKSGDRLLAYRLDDLGVNVTPSVTATS